MRNLDQYTTDGENGVLSNVSFEHGLPDSDLNTNRAAARVLYSVALTGGKAEIKNISVRDYLINKDSLVFVSCFALSLTALDSLFFENNQSIQRSLVLLVILSCLCYCLTFFATKTFMLLAEIFGLKYLYIPISSFFVVNLVYLNWLWLDPYIIHGQLSLNKYRITEFFSLYLIVQVASIFFIHFVVVAVNARRTKNNVHDAAEHSPMAGKLSDAMQPATALGNTMIDIGDQKFRIDSLINISSEEHYVRIHTQEDERLIRYRLSVIAEQLDEAGTLVHRSHWVAYSQIKEVGKNGRKFYALMSNGIKVPIEPSRKDSVIYMLSSFSSN